MQKKSSKLLKVIKFRTRTIALNKFELCKHKISFCHLELSPMNKTSNIVISNFESHPFKWQISQKSSTRTANQLDLSASVFAPFLEFQSLSVAWIQIAISKTISKEGIIRFIQNISLQLRHHNEIIKYTQLSLAVNIDQTEHTYPNELQFAVRVNHFTLRA